MEPTAEPPLPRTRRALGEITSIALVLAMAWAWLAAVSPPCDPDDLYSDETRWVAISILHWDQLVHGAPPAGAELDPPRWQGPDPWRRGVQRTTFGYPSPCLPKLVWGGLLHGAGFGQASPLTFSAFLQHDLEGGEAAQAQLQPALPLARKVVLALACLTTLLVFLVGRAALPGPWGWLAGALACLLWLASPVVQATAGCVRTDYFMLPFVLAALLLVLRRLASVAGERGAPAQWRSGLWLGLLCGLAVSSKLNGGLACVFVALALPLLRWRARGRGCAGWGRGTGLALILAGALACGVFWVLNPRLGSEPLTGVADILARWRETTGFLQEDWARRAGTATGSTLSESVALFLGRSFGAYEPWRTLTGLPGGIVLTLTGLGGLAWRALRRRDVDGEAAIALALLLFVLVLCAGTALWLPFDWERYYLPTTACLALVQATTLAWLARLLALGLRRGASA